MRHINVHVGDSPLPLHPFSVAAAAAPPPPPPSPPPLATPVCLGLFHFRGDALRILHFTNVPVISRDTRSFEFGVSKGWYRSVLLKICRPIKFVFLSFWITDGIDSMGNGFYRVQFFHLSSVESSFKLERPFSFHLYHSYRAERIVLQVFRNSIISLNSWVIFRRRKKKRRGRGKETGRRERDEVERESVIRARGARNVVAW